MRINRSCDMLDLFVSSRTDQDDDVVDVDDFDDVTASSALDVVEIHK